jgi:hypothetical protein
MSGGVSGVIVLEPSARNTRNPHQSVTFPRRIAADVCRSSTCNAASGRRIRARQ